jgi:indole-3-glycerol phosphate synthase
MRRDSRAEGNIDARIDGRGFPYTQAKSMTVRPDTFLETILASTRATVAATKAVTPLGELERRALAHHPRGWAAALRKQATLGTAVIAEVKKASPSKGVIRADFDPAWVARRYRAGGAAALSVLTDEPYFQGSLRNLQLASAAVPLPCLRKDFIFDEYQIVEARAYRADAILLIAAALSSAEMKHLASVANGFSLDVLVEVHTREELDRVLDSGIVTGIAASGASGVGAIGVNNRDLRTFEVTLETSLALIERIPASVVRVTESGLNTAQDIARMRQAGFNAFLIGESLMRASDPGAALEALLQQVPSAV